MMANQNNPAIYPVRNEILILSQKPRLQHPLNLPLAIYNCKDENGEMKYLMGSKIAEIICKAVRKVYPDLKEDEIMKFSAHSLRVWACVLLDEAVKNADFIKNRLHWLG